MATVVDTLVTKYTLDSSGYQQGAKHVVGATQGIASKIGVLAGTAGALSISGLAAFAINSAVSFDTLTRSLTAVTKSGERARDVMSFVDKLAIPSVFDSEGLAQAATTLEAFGLTTERWLPVAEKLGTVFGGTAQDLMQFVNALGMLRAGRGGEALEALSRAGISRENLTKRGVRFDKGGQALSSVKDLMLAVEAEVNTRFGNLGSIMGGGAAAKFASFTDALKRGMRDVGNAILEFGLPYLEKFSGWIQAMTQNGSFRRFGDQAVSMFQATASAAGALWNILQVIPKPVIGLIAALSLLKPIFPALQGGASLFGTALKTSLEKGVKATAVMAAEMAGVMALILGAQWMADRAMKGIDFLNMRNEARGRVGSVKRDANGRWLKGKDGKPIPWDENSPEYWSAVDAEMQKMREERAQLNAGDSDLSKELADAIKKAQSELGGMGGDVQGEQARLLRAIEQNTAPLREVMSYILGGGELGRPGVSIVSMRGTHRTSGNPTRTIRALTSMGMLSG